MAPRAVAGSSSVGYRWTYDVFLSFRGEDTRLNFVGHLYESLRQIGIYTFIDDESLHTGEEIRPSLFKAIQESRIAIIVFSKNYASSTFCLDELAKIIECFKGEGRWVYPVFYYVDPSEVRHQKGSYGEALAHLQKRLQDEDKLQKWRLALSQAANLSGWHLQSGIAKEQEFIRRITYEISTKINRTPLHVTNNPVGLVSRVQKVASLLDLWSDEEVKMVGICGTGGIGKSTIARAVYNLIADHFEGLCFISNVRKESKMPNGLSHLQETLLRKLVREKDLKLGDFYEGIPIIKHRLGQKKILLILDDIDKMEQLEALAGSCDWFGSGSRIIITTRNRQLLVSHDVESIYDVKELNEKESLQLLSWYAFRKENVESNFIEVSNRAILYSCGFPLALEVIGSNLCGKGVEEWHFALDQFKRIPEERVLEALKLSYDALAEVEKKIFLDLACFFKGEKLGNVKNMLLCLHGIQPEYAIGVLIDKSLIKIERDRVTMHDLIEDMGREIIRQESLDEPGERSRLWFYQDILHVLKQNTGTTKVEAIILDLPEGNGVQVQWSGKAFMKMKKLKMLVIKNASFSKCPKCFPNSLRWLEWKGYPFEFLPYNICSTELIYLDMSCSYFKLLQPFAKKFQSLSCMNFRNCKALQQIPDLSEVSNLRELWLDDCTNLTKIHDSVGCLNKLRELRAMRCKNLKILPLGLRLPSLKHLNLFGCSSLQNFPEILVQMRNIQTLDLDRTAIIELPSSICNLIGLEILNMEECPNLEQLPASICMLPNLWALTANSCEGMRQFKIYEGGEEASLDSWPLPLKLEQFCFSNCNLSEDSLTLCLSYFTNMIHLDLSFNNFTTLPACIKECHHLRYLLLDNCKQLQYIGGMPPNLEKFSARCCMSLTKSSKSKVLNQALSSQPGKRNFIFPSKKFPESLDIYSPRSFVSFWVHDVFPTIFLWILVKHDQDFLFNCTFMVHINDTKLDISSEWLLLSTIKTGHLYICDLQSLIHKAELPLVYTWNNVKVSIKSNTQDVQCESKIHFALHVYKQNNNSENIRLMDPRTYVDYNSWQKVQPQDWEELGDDMQYQDPRKWLRATYSRPQKKVRVVSLSTTWTYDVFVSFNGEESSSFVSDLHHSLCRTSIRAFINDELIYKGEKELTAMRESRMAIIVLSKSYTSSPFCLDKLAAILEFFEDGRGLVCPIFYNVDPGKLSYDEVFIEVEKRFKDNIQMVQIWRSTLLKAAYLRGWRVNFKIGEHDVIERVALSQEKIRKQILDRIATERYFIERITADVSKMIGMFPLRVPNFPSRPGSRLQEVISFLDVNSKDKVKMVGICGTGGIGKSTITRAVCDWVADHFEESWVFPCDNYFPSHLKEKPLYERDRDSILYEFCNLITHWFRQKKNLVIFDNVVNLDQLRPIVGMKCDGLGDGSRIIITTRNKELLVSNGIERIYEVKKLSNEEAFQLFCWNAFVLDKVNKSYMDVSKRAIRYAGGLPSAVEAIGSYLRGKTVDEWNSVLNEMEKDPKQMLSCLERHSWNVGEWLKELGYLKEKEPQTSVHSSTEKVTYKRKREDTELMKDTIVKGKKCHA